MCHLPWRTKVLLVIFARFLWFMFASSNPKVQHKQQTLAKGRQWVNQGRQKSDYGSPSLCWSKTFSLKRFFVPEIFYWTRLRTIGHSDCHKAKVWSHRVQVSQSSEAEKKVLNRRAQALFWSWQSWAFSFSATQWVLWRTGALREGRGKRSAFWTVEGGTS